MEIIIIAKNFKILNEYIKFCPPTDSFAPPPPVPSLPHPVGLLRWRRSDLLPAVRPPPPYGLLTPFGHRSPCLPSPRTEGQAGWTEGSGHESVGGAVREGKDTCPLSPSFPSFPPSGPYSYSFGTHPLRTPSGVRGQAGRAVGLRQVGWRR
jgi:hypothetical protein